MEQFLQQITNAPHKEILVVTICVGVFFYWLINKPFERLFDFIREFKLRDVDSEQMRLLLENDNFSDDLSASLVEYYEGSAFYKAYGIKADKEMRTALLGFYSAHQKEISWKDINGAYKNIYLDESLSINIKPMVISTLYQFILNLGNIISGLSVIVSALNYIFFDDSDSADLILGGAILYSVMFNFFHTIEWRSRSSRKLEECIGKVKDEKLKEQVF